MVELLNADLSVLGILVATILNIVVGMAWFSPNLLGKTWLTLVNKSINDLVAKPSDYMLSILKALTEAVVLNFLISYAITAFGNDSSTLLVSVFVAFIVWLGFTVTSASNLVIWEGRNKKLFLFNMSHELVSVIVMAVAIGLFL